MIKRKASILNLTFAAALVALFAIPAGADPPDRVTICHKFGTPAEKTMTLPAPAAAGHMQGHGDTLGACRGVPPTVDSIIDADGIASPQSGDPAFREVVPGDPLKDFPVTGPAIAGLDMFDQDGSQDWTDGDDLHAEDPQTCPTATRDGIHQLGRDCKVLDINNSLVDGEQVDCDIEVGFGFTFNPCPPPEVTWHDVDNDGSWDTGEDIVFDANLDNIFN